MSKREGPNTAPEPKRARTNETVEVPEKLLRTILRRTHLNDDEWDDLLEWLPKESVDKLLPKLDANHYLRRLFEREEREKVINELNSLGPTRLILNEDASELTLTLPESFQNIFEEPLQQNVTLRRSMHKVNDALNGRKYFDESGEVDPPMPEERSEVFYFTEINPGLTNTFRKMVTYAEEFIKVLNGALKEERLALNLGPQLPNQVRIAITFNKGHILEQYQNCMIVYFGAYYHSRNQSGLPLGEQAASDLSNLVTRLSTLEGIYGRERIELEQQRRDYLSSWELVPENSQQIRIVFKDGLKSIFVINGVSGAISDVSLRHEGYSGPSLIYKSQDLPQNLTIDRNRIEEIQDELDRGLLTKQNSKVNYVLSRHSAYIYNDHSQYLILDFDPGDDVTVTEMTLFTEAKNVLSTWWQYAKDDPEEVVNVAASRRQDLLGM